MKAKYIGKSHGTGYNRHIVYLEYEYRGIKYTVEENRAKGNEPLAWQHRAEQSRIDVMLDTPKQVNGKPFDMDEIWDMMGWD